MFIKRVVDSATLFFYHPNKQSFFIYFCGANENAAMKFKNVYFIISFIISFQILNAQVRKTVNAVRINYSPDIDGVIAEKEWKLVPSATDFIQYEPHPGKPSSFPSVVKMAYNHKGLYIAAILYDTEPDKIKTELARRDEIEDVNCDIFGVQLVPFDDGKNSFEFKVSAANVQSDNKSSGHQMDKNWDAVWKSAVVITDSSWNVEMMIPWSQIRFPKSDTQNWGINFWRHIRRFREWSSYQFVDKHVAGILTQTARATGIYNIKAPLRLSMFPYVSGYMEKYPENDNVSFSINYGADLKYGLNESFTLDMTLIPDFGQVQSDDLVLNLSPFEVYYDEKRQFFTEGTEMFNRGGIFYSRRIGGRPAYYYSVEDSLREGEEIIINPDKTHLINAAKISGRTNKGLGIGIFNAMTSPSHALVEDSLGRQRKITTQHFTDYNMLVFDQNLPNNSYFAVANTFVGRKGYNATVTAIQSELRNKRNSYSIFSKAALSRKSQIGSRPEPGYTYFIELRKISGNFRFELNNKVESDTYDPNDMGFLRANNEYSYNLKLQYNIYEPFWKVNYWRNRFKVSYQALFRPREFSSLWFEANSNTTFNNYLSVGVSTWFTPIESNDFYEPRVDGWKFIKKPVIGSGAWISTDYRKPLAMDVYAHYNHAFEYLINQYKLNVSFRFRFSDRSNLRWRVNNEMTFNDLGYAETEYDSLQNPTIYFGKRNLFTHSQVVQFNYLFNNKISLSWRMRYYWSTADYASTLKILNPDGYLYESDKKGNYDINYSTLNLDAACTWYFAPGSELNLVWKNFIYHSSDEIVRNYFDNLGELLNMSATNSLSLKVLYYLDYQYFKRS